MNLFELLWEIFDDDDDDDDGGDDDDDDDGGGDDDDDDDDGDMFDVYLQMVVHMKLSTKLIVKGNDVSDVTINLTTTVIIVTKRETCPLIS